MPAKRVAIVAALTRELAPLLRGVTSRSIDGVTIYDLDDAVVAVGGMGRNAATRTAETLIKHAQPEILISAGVVGALRAELKAGDVVIAREVMNAETGDRFITNRLTTEALDGVVVTVDAIEGEPAKRALWNRLGGDVVDMEAAAVADVAHERGLEFAAVKAVSDELCSTMPPLGRFVDNAGKFHTGRFLAYIAVHPRWWHPVKVLGKNTQLASVNLSQALEHLIQQYSKPQQEENVTRG